MLFTVARRARQVKPLSPQDGSVVLFESSDISKPRQVQKDKAMELGKHYKGNALANHAAAHALIAKGRTLETYTPGLTLFRAKGRQSRTSKFTSMPKKTRRQKSK